MKTRQMYFTTVLLGLWVLLGACTSSPAQPKIARIEVSPAALLLTKAGESQVLSAKVFDDQGKEVKTAVTWSSSKPAAVSVDASGKVTAVSGLGSAQISAQVGNLKGSVIAVMAQPVAGAVLVSDAQIEGDPQPVDANVAFGVGFQYRINLKGTTPPNPGSILLSSGEKPVAGKVVAVNGNTVTLEVVPIDEVFAQLDINESYNLAEANFTTPQAIAQNFETQQLPDGRIKLSQKAGLVLRSQGGVSSQAEFGAGPFQCKTEGNLIQIQLAKSELAFSPNLKLDTVWNATQKKIVVSGQPTVSLEITPVLAAAINAKVTCKLTLREIQIPLPGPLGIFLGAVIPIGAGFELEGKVPITQVGVKFKAEVGADIQMGFACTPTCAPVQSLKSNHSGNATPIIPQSFQGFKIEASFYAFLFADLEAGARLASLSNFRVGAIEGTAGVKLEAKLASEETQIADTAYASNYKLAFEAVIGAADEFEAFLKMVKVTVAKPELKLTQDIAFSPAATATADKASFQEAEVVKVKVKLDPSKMEFPIIGYNVESVRIYRKSLQPSGAVVPVLVAEANASNMQTEFELSFVATLSGTVKDNFVVFVKTRLLPDLRLELGDVGASVGCTASAGVKYCVTALSAPGESRSSAGDINDVGQVVGTSFEPNRSRGFVWQNGQITFLTEPNQSSAFAINSLGQIAGAQIKNVNGGTLGQAFVWQNGQITDLGTPTGISSTAVGINDAGQVVGQMGNSAYIYKDGQMTALSGLGSPSSAADINNKGQVVGHISTTNGLQSFLWDNAQITNLGVLPGMPSSTAFGLNNNGQVVGASFNFSGKNEAFIWENGTMTKLPEIAAGNSQAIDINDLGQVIGTSGARPVLWLNGTVTDLNTLIDPASGFRLIAASAINNKGQIVGTGSPISGGSSRAVLLTPVQP